VFLSANHCHHRQFIFRSHIYRGLTDRIQFRTLADGCQTDVSVSVVNYGRSVKIMHDKKTAIYIVSSGEKAKREAFVHVPVVDEELFCLWAALGYFRPRSLVSSPLPWQIPVHALELASLKLGRCRVHTVGMHSCNTI